MLPEAFFPIMINVEGNGVEKVLFDDSVFDKWMRNVLLNPVRNATHVRPDASSYIRESVHELDVRSIIPRTKKEFRSFDSLIAHCGLTRSGQKTSLIVIHFQLVDQFLNF